MFVRQNGPITNGQGTVFANYYNGTHRAVNANPWDGKWHNLTVVAETITNELQPVIEPMAAPASGSITFIWSSTPLDSAFGNNITQVDTNQQYILQRSTNLADPLGWINVATQATGGFLTTNTFNNPTNATAFYRVVQPGVRLQNWSFYMDGMFISSSLKYTNGVNTHVPPGIPLPNPADNGNNYLQNTGNEPGGSDPDAIQPPLGIWQCDVFGIGGLFRDGSAGSYFVGAIDDVAVWKRALSPAEIAEYMGMYNPIPVPVVSKR